MALRGKKKGRRVGRGRGRGTESEGLLERSSNEDSSEEETDTPPEGYEDLGKGGKLNAVNKAAKNKLAVSCIAFESCKHINTDTNDRPCS
jgi:hypothetical protein